VAGIENIPGQCLECQRASCTFAIQYVSASHEPSFLCVGFEKVVYTLVITCSELKTASCKCVTSTSEVENDEVERLKPHGSAQDSNYLFRMTISALQMSQPAQHTLASSIRHDRTEIALARPRTPTRRRGKRQLWKLAPSTGSISQSKNPLGGSIGVDGRQLCNHQVRAGMTGNAAGTMHDAVSRSSQQDRRVTF
jgi:hypothetical protein